ncbi:N-acetylglucosamine-1-phosphotransferase subunits alpha/beta [Achlya hypogyna]|uniref:N-acetylglucosamine-1-phosphotransferase subunits alpha/beta n=1 Tax=Achlya hypogyna TaxID=1202772 RepID=A0A1V9ZI21_ACHHY|nr:N-acetylglucosamine-1-phosphotransferase subunits alpha/beta [Achlya hypogyna]
MPTSPRAALLLAAVVLFGLHVYAARTAGVYNNIGNVAPNADYDTYGPIDAVYTWVNGSDAAWRSVKNEWHLKWLSEIYGRPIKTNPRTKDSAASENRFRDNDELRYSIRSLHMFAPWIRHIYIVTNGQIPSWLDTTNPHVTVVPHASIFPNASHLPTFASPAIEANLDNIPGLSEHFLYFNDEVLLGAPVTPEDFLSKQGTQNVYMSWEIPPCNDGCGNWMLGNGVCNQACNVEMCGFDHGDCACDKAEAPVVAANWLPICRAPDQLSTETTAPPCATGCDWAALGDGTCNAQCNFAECGFDAGDCGARALDVLPRATFAPSTTDAALLVDPASYVVVVNTSTPAIRATVGDVEMPLVTRAVLVPESPLLLLFLSRDAPRAVATVVISRDPAALHLQVVPYGRKTPVGYSFVATAADALDLERAIVSTADDQMTAIHLPFGALPAAQSPVEVAVDDAPVVVCPGVDGPAASPDGACRLNATGLLVLAPASARVCFRNSGTSACLDVAASPLVVAATIADADAYALPKTKHECAWWEWCSVAYPTLASRCTTSATKLLVAKDEGLAQEKAITLCTRMGADLAFGPFSREETQPLLNKMCRIMNTTEPLPHWLTGCGATPTPTPINAAIASADTFGDSLRHVNKLYDTAFGKALKARRVPSHMPHFIQKRLFRELKARYAAEFNATSAHRFRHPEDMQFGFSYMHYVMNRRALHPPTATPEVFASLIDVNQNGYLDGHEEANAIALFPAGDQPAVAAALDACRATANGSVTLRHVQEACPVLDRRLGLAPAELLPPATRTLSEEQVTFLMLGESMGAYGQLYRARSRRTKFVCINDDMNNPTLAFRTMLHDFFERRWGTPSPLELQDNGDLGSLEELDAAADEKPRLRASSQAVDVNLAGLWPYQLGLALVSSGILYFIGMKKRWRTLSRSAKARAKSAAPRVAWRTVVLGVGGALGAAAIGFLLLLLHVDEVDPGYYVAQRYGNIGNIDLAKDAPFMGYGPIDVVYTWVNGTDPRWKKEKNFYHRRWHAEIHGEYFNETDEANVVDASAAATENRFRDNEELRYSLRSIEKYAPWVRHVFLVTDGQVPSWLNTDCPRLTVVPHREMFTNTSHLPVFSSPAIEANLDTIPGLADHFLYFNDDVFLGAPVTPEDFMSPSGVQNIYLSWEVPECAPGCKEHFLNNGACDAMCNVTACAFDMGDCGCHEVPHPENPLQEPDVFCSAPPEGEVAEPPSSPPPTPTDPLLGHLCVDGCTYSWIGDGVCDHRCNVTECAFDGGDCGISLLELLPTVNVPANSSQFTLEVPLAVPVVVVNISDVFAFVDTATLDSDALVRHALLQEADMGLVLVLARSDSNGSPTNVSRLALTGEPSRADTDDAVADLALNIMRGLKPLPRGRYTPGTSAVLDLADIELQRQDANASLVDLEVALPFFVVPDWGVDVRVMSTWTAPDGVMSFEALCPAIAPETPVATDAAADGARSDCFKDENHLRVRWTWSAPATPSGVLAGQVCVWNGPASSCVAVALATGEGFVVHPQTRAEPWNGVFDQGEDCLLVDFAARVLGGVLRGNCPPRPAAPAVVEEAPTSMPPPVDPFVHEQAVLMCRQLASRRQKTAAAEASWWRDVAQHFKAKLGLATVVAVNTSAWYSEVADIATCAAYFALRPAEVSATPLPPPDAAAAASKDTFGDSLRHVNKIYNAVFGKTPTPDRRRVPSHMPHFIQKQLLTEMKARWPREFNATSAHRFRHPKDMQFSFSYMYYVVNRHLLHPPTLEDVFAEYIDLNRDGRIDDHEVLSVAALLTTAEHPAEADVAAVKACLAPPPVERVLVANEVRRGGIIRVTETTQPHKTLESLRACGNVTAQLIATAAARRPAMHRFVSEAEVTFHMLSDQYRTAWNQLLNTRARRTKFVCINDDMKYPSPAVSGILGDLFNSLWPDRSQFELPFGLANKYGHVDEIAAGRRNQWQIGAAAIAAIGVLYAVLLWLMTADAKEEDDSSKATVE